jgi:hypothetical protein
LAINGDGNYATPTTNLPSSGYYTYVYDFPAQSTQAALSTVCGESGEVSAAQTTPVVSTTVSDTTSTVGSTIHDSIVVSGLPTGYNDSVSWSLYGPFQTAPDATSCTPGTLATSGSLPVTVDGTFQTSDFTLTDSGYYTYVESLPASAFSSSVETVCGAVTETSLASYQPSISTAISSSKAVVGTSVHDSVTISGTAPGFTGSTEWAVYGPFQTLPTSTSCTGTPFATGSTSFTGSGTFNTQDVKLTSAGYYTYTQAVPAGANQEAVSSGCALPSETVLVSAPTPTPTSTSTSTSLPKAGADVPFSPVRPLMALLLGFLAFGLAVVLARPKYLGRYVRSGSHL